MSKSGSISRKHLTDREKEFIKKHYPTNKDQWIADKINRSRRTVNTYARSQGLRKDLNHLKKLAIEHNLKVNKDTNWKKSWINLLKNYYDRKPKTFFLKRIPKNWQAIVAKASKLGVSRREFYYEERINKAKLPKPSKDFAWFLGVLSGDGWVSSNRIAMSVKDKDFADKFLLRTSRPREVILKYDRFGDSSNPAFLR